MTHCIPFSSKYAKFFYLIIYKDDIIRRINGGLKNLNCDDTYFSRGIKWKTFNIWIILNVEKKIYSIYMEGNKTESG